MTLLVLADDYKPNFGGIAEYINSLISAVHRAGDPVVVLAPETIGAAHFDATVPYEVFRIAPEAGFRGRQRRRLLALAREAGPAWVLSASLSSFPDAGLRLARDVDASFGIFVYGQEINQRLRSLRHPRALAKAVRRRRRASRFLRAADAVICCSDFTSSRVQDHFGPATRTSVVRPGIEAPPTLIARDEARRRLAIGGSPVLLSVGRLVARKGIDRALEAAALVARRHPNLIYAIVGDGPSRQDLEMHTRRLQLQDRVRFSGWVDDEQKALYYSAADVFVLPNRELPGGDVEGFGIVFLEAAAYGIPTIGGRSGGAPEAIVDGETGLLVAPGDTKQLTETLERLLADHELCRSLGENGRARALKQFTWASAAEALRSILRSDPPIRGNGRGNLSREGRWGDSSCHFDKRTS